MKIFHFHKWSKWEEYDHYVSEHVSPMSRGNWYGYIESWSEKWEKRTCQVCGRTQRRKVSPLVLTRKQNLKVTQKVFQEGERNES